MALGEFDCDFNSKLRPKDQSSMRKHLQEVAAGLRDEMLKKTYYSAIMTSDEGRKAWDESKDSLFKTGIDYGNEEFMKKLENEKYVNNEHWIDADFVLPIFSKEWKLKVVLYIQNKVQWQTHVYDGRRGEIEIERQDGLIPVEPGERTFGMFYNGIHYEYIRIK
jgi:hypothetical protein